MRQIRPELERATRLFWGVDYLLRERQSGAPTPPIGNMISFGKDIAGQYVVCKHRCGRHEDLVGHNQLLIQHGLMNLVLIGVTQQGVVAQTEERLNRIRIFCRHGSKDIGRVCHMTAHHKIRIGKAPGFLCRLFQHFSDAVGEYRMIVVAQLLFFLRIRQAFVETQLGFRNVGFREASQRFAANHIQIAGYRPQNGVQSDRRRRRQLLIRNRRPRNHRSVRVSVHPRRGCNIVFGNAGNLSDPSQGIFVDALLQFVKTNAPVFHKRLVI